MRHRAHTPHARRPLIPATSLAIVLAVGILGACGDDDDEPSDTTAVTTTSTASTQPDGTAMPPETTTGIANPASVFCLNSGGTIEIVDEAAGQIAYCNLPDGTRFEEWDYFRQMSSTTTTG